MFEKIGETAVMEDSSSQPTSLTQWTALSGSTLPPIVVAWGREGTLKYAILTWQKMPAYVHKSNVQNLGRTCIY